MTKEDKQIIDRAVKEEWRIGDRSRLKRLLEKNLKLYRENVELERKLEQAEKDLADYQFNYPTIKELEKENAELREKIEVLECDNYNANCNLNLITDQLTKAKEHIQNLLGLLPEEVLYHDYYKRTCVEPAEQFLKEIEK